MDLTKVENDVIPNSVQENKRFSNITIFGNLGVKLLELVT